MKRKAIYTFIIFHLLASTCTAQINIYYQFDKCVLDSLQNGINLFAKLNKKSPKDLQLYVLISETNNEYGLYLQEYSFLPKGGIRDLIKSSNRKLKVNGDFTIPILFPSDILSDQLIADKIQVIPYSGYYLKVVNENYKQKVVMVSNLF